MRSKSDYLISRGPSSLKHLADDFLIPNQMQSIGEYGYHYSRQVLKDMNALPSVSQVFNGLREHLTQQIQDKSKSTH